MYIHTGQFWVWIAPCIGFITTKAQGVPFNLPLMAERHELFIILSIGEVIAAGLAIPDSHADADAAGGGGAGHGASTNSSLALVHQAVGFAGELLVEGGHEIEDGDGSGGGGGGSGGSHHHDPSGHSNHHSNATGNHSAHGGAGGGAHSSALYNEYATVALVVLMAGR